MERHSADIPWTRVAVGLVGLFVGVSMGIGLGAWLQWDPADWRYIVYNVIMLSAVVIFILRPGRRPRGHPVEGR